MLPGSHNFFFGNQKPGLFEITQHGAKNFQGRVREVSLAQSLARQTPSEGFLFVMRDNFIQSCLFESFKICYAL